MIGPLTRVMWPSCYVVLPLVIMKLLRILLKASLTSLLISSTTAGPWVVSSYSAVITRSSIIASISIISTSIIAAACRVVFPLLQIGTLL